MFATTALNNMKSNAATQAEGTVIVGGGIAGLAMAAALRNVAGGELCVHKMCVAIILCAQDVSIMSSVDLPCKLCASLCNLLTLRIYQSIDVSLLLLRSLQCQSIGSKQQSRL